MKIMKFGGTSVGSAQRIKNVAKLVTSKSGQNIVVLSAMSGTTNSLVEISNYFYKKNPVGAKELINGLQNKYHSTIEELFDLPENKEKARLLVGREFEFLRNLSNADFGVKEEKEALSRGELLSTGLMDLYLKECGIKVMSISALDFMKTDIDGEPDSVYLKEKLMPVLHDNSDADVFLTQGFICRNSDGDIDNLQRGGSDYSASLIGAAVNAEEIEIWTDIDGMHNNDPRFVDGTRPVNELHFEEAAELAYFGAKILHPTCVLPAKLNNIPVRLLNTMAPEAPGTLIYNASPSREIKAVAAKDNITAIKIKSGRMLLAYGFLRKVFEIFETNRTPIDMVVTSEVGVSVTIDNEKRLDAIVDELKQYGTVTIDRDMVIICVVGDLEWKNRGFEADVVNALKDIPVRMISYGGSNYNISLLVRKEDKVKALNLLSERLFNK